MRTITFDEAIYKLVPMIPTPEMRAVAWNADGCYAAAEAAIAAVPDTLPGVVEHSGKPCASILIVEDHHPRWSWLNPLNKPENGKHELFTHPPAQPVVQIPVDVQAALDRMCTPLHESWLNGATAECDSRSMAIIKRYIESTIAPAQPDTEALSDSNDSFTIKAFQNLAEALKARIAELEAQRDNLIQQAQIQEQEARTQRSIVINTLKALGLPENDWEATGLIVGKVAELEAQLAAQAGQEPVYMVCFADICGSAEDGKWREASKDAYYTFTERNRRILYSKPTTPPNSLAIVQAALDAAAVIAESFCACDSSIEQEAVNFTAKNKAQRIRAINPQSIIDEVGK